MDIAAVTAEPTEATVQHVAVDAESQPADNPVNAEENRFQKAVTAWRNIDLLSLIPTLDTTASDIVTYQRDALVERKELAQKTKDFRKLDDASKLNEFKGLLKAYQSYIDLVSTSNKTISSSFLQIYSSLSEAPDPYPLLEASVESLVTVEETLPKLEAENKHLHSITSKLTAQLEEAEKRLEDERSARQALEAAGDTQVKKVEESWSAVLEEKQTNWETRERTFEERAVNQERLLKELKASYEVSQRLSRGEEADGDMSQGSAAAAELDIVSSELERANIRLAEVQARNEQLRLELAQSATGRGASQRSGVTEDDPAFLRLRSENSSLLRKVDAARYERDTEKRDWESSTRTLTKEINALKGDAEALRTKVGKWSDYDDIKRELDVLKSIEFSTGENEDLVDDDEQTVSTGEEPTSQRDSAQKLEQLLLARNKKLNNELTVLRVSHQDLAGRLEMLQNDLSNTNMELEKSRNLNATLENDLARMQQETTSSYPSGAMSVAGTYTSRHPASTYHGRRVRAASPTSSIISGFDGPNTLDSLRGDNAGGGSSILPMVTAQRDRFKKRNTELETELSKTYQTVQSLRSEVAALQKDNLNLYEKTRYTATYNARATQSTATDTYQPPSSTVVDEESAAPLDRYRTAYETKLSPFAAFRGRESSRALKRMTLPERMALRATQGVLASRTSRNLFAAYFVAMHVLVFFMLISGGGGASARQAVPLAAGAGAGSARMALKKAGEALRDKAPAVLERR